MTPALTLTLALLSTPPLAAPPQDVPEPTTAQGEHFNVVCWFHSERFGEGVATGVVEVLEGLWGEAGSLYGSRDPAGSIDVNVYPRRGGPEGYRAAVEGIEAGAAGEDYGWSLWEARGVFVQVQPPVTDRVMGEMGGLPARTLRRALREAAELLCLDASGGQDRSPAWFAGGSADWLAGRVLVTAGRAAPGVADPWLSTRVIRVRALGEEGRLPALEEILHDRLPDLSPEEVGALQEVFFTFLMEHCTGDGWTALWQGLAAGMGEGELDSALAQRLGEGGIAGLESAFGLWLQAQPVAWEEQWPALERDPQGWLQTTVRGKTALCWSTTLPPGDEYLLSGEFKIYRDRRGVGQANLLMGLLDGDYIQISFNVTSGLAAMSYSHETGLYTEIQKLSATVPPGEWIPFDVAVKDDMVTAVVGGLGIKPFDILGRDVSGPWGVGVFRGGTALWRNLKVAPLPEED